MIYYSFKIKGAKGFVHELLSAPFGAHRCCGFRICC